MTLEHKSVAVFWLIGALIIVGIGYSMLNSLSTNLEPLQDYHKQLNSLTNY